MIKKLFVPIVFLLSLFSIFVLSAQIFTSDDNLTNSDIKKCSDLNFKESLKLHPKKFSSVNLELKFDSIRQWRRDNLRSLVRAEKNKDASGYFIRFHTDRKRVDGKVIFSIDKKTKCSIKARIRAHGDLEDHLNTSLPSLNINLKDGHIYGITKFKLFIPKTRRFDNEIIASNLFRELGLLAPRTSKAKVKFYNKDLNFIFQESIVKEFLENSAVREFPLYAGDERFSFFDFDSQKGNRFSNFKLENTSFTKNEKSKIMISKYGLSLLNKINIYGENEFYPQSIDFSELSKKLYGKNLFKDFQIFSSLTYAMNANHNLSRDDIRIYFNKETDKFHPIYYDGAPKLGEKNQFLDNECLKYLNKADCNFTKSGIRGAKKALDLLESLNVADFKKKILKLNSYKKNLKLNDKKTILISDLDIIIAQIKKNLLSLSSTNLEENSRVIESKINNSPYISYINNNKKINKPNNRKLVFHSNNFKNFQTCNIFSSECDTSELEQKDISNLISQRLKISNNRKDVELNYTSRTNDGENSIWFHEFFKKNFPKKRKIIIENKLNFFVIGNIQYEIQRDQKILSFVKKDKFSKIIFENQNIDGWKILFKDTSETKKNVMNFSRLDSDGYTGCLNFFDTKISDLKIKFLNSKCEDAVNFVRSEGIISEIEVKNSLFDSIDGDFSILEFKKIIIDKSKNDCLDFSFGDYIIKNANLSFCGDKGISVGELAKVKINESLIKNTNSAIVSKDFAEVKVSNSEIVQSKYCFQAYNKKQEFSGGYLVIENTSCDKSNKIKMENDKKSIIEIL